MPARRHWVLRYAVPCTRHVPATDIEEALRNKTAQQPHRTVPRLLERHPGVIKQSIGWSRLQVLTEERQGPHRIDRTARQQQRLRAHRQVAGDLRRRDALTASMHGNPVARQHGAVLRQVQRMRERLVLMLMRPQIKRTCSMVFLPPRSRARAHADPSHT